MSGKMKHSVYLSCSSRGGKEDRHLRSITILIYIAWMVIRVAIFCVPAHIILNHVGSLTFYKNFKKYIACD